MKKIALLGGSVLLFLILSIVAFTFDSGNSGRSDGSVQTAVKERASSESANTSRQRENPEVERPSSTIAPVQEKNFSGNMIEDIRAQYRDNSVLVTWKVPQTNDIQDLKLIRTPSYPEGLAATYNVANSGGSYLDTTVKPGGRYYYELRGRNMGSDLASDIVAVEIPGSMRLAINDYIFIVNGKQMQYSSLKTVKPFVLNGKIMIPAKSVIDNLGGYVNWVNGKNSKALTEIIVKYKKYEIEMFAGKSEIIVNRGKRTIDYVPIVKDTVFYVSLNMLNEFLDCRVQLEGNTIIIEKVIDPMTFTNKANSGEQEIQIAQGEEFEISLNDENQDGKSWFNNAGTYEGVVLKDKKLGEKDKRTSLYILRFGVIRSGDYNLAFRYFNPKIGETANDKVMIYRIRSKQR